MDKQAFEEFQAYSGWMCALLFVFFALLEVCIILGFLLVEYLT